MKWFVSWLLCRVFNIREFIRHHLEIAQKRGSPSFRLEQRFNVNNYLIANAFYVRTVPSIKCSPIRLRSASYWLTWWLWNNWVRAPMGRCSWCRRRNWAGSNKKWAGDGNYHPINSKLARIWHWNASPNVKLSRPRAKNMHIARRQLSNN